jgi:hypothetical protein
MKREFRIAAAISALTPVTVAVADTEFARPLNHSASEKAVAQFEFSYFDASFDFLDYAEKIQSRSKPDQVKESSVSLHMPVAQRISFDYQYTDTFSRITRSAQPYELSTDGFKHQLQGNYWLTRSERFSTFLHIGLDYAKQKPIEIDCYDYNGLVLGGTCEEADFRLLDGQALINDQQTIYYPAMSTDANSFGFSLGATVTNNWPGDIEAYQYLGFEQTKINVRYRSDILKIADPFALGISFKGYTLGDVISELKADLPQDTPWKDRTWVVEAGAKKNFGSHFFITGALRYYAVSRVDYIANEQNEDYNGNTVLNLAAWYVPTAAIKVYLRGEASTNNVLGSEPIAYNRKTSKFFAHPFGQLSVGFIFSPDH